MPTVLVLYPAYGTLTCADVGRYAREIPGLKFALADDEPASGDEAVYDEIIEIPPPELVGEGYEMMRRWCDRRKPDGIMMQSERGLLLGSLLAREFGLKGPGVEAAHLCANKYAQRVALSRAGICTPSFALAESAGEVRRLAADYGYPLVLKCVISTMSRLVTLVCREEDVEAAVARMRAALAESRDVARLVSFTETAKVDLGCDPARQFLVESFQQGDLVETDGLVVGSKPFTFGVTEQIQSVDPPFFLEGYLFPAECTENGPIESVSDRMIKAIGLGDSGFSNEMRVSGPSSRAVEQSSSQAVCRGTLPRVGWSAVGGRQSPAPPRCSRSALRSGGGVVRTGMAPHAQTAGACVIEVNGRLGWDEGFGRLFEVRTHRERIFQTVQLALGIQPDLIRDESRFAAIAYRCCYIDGVVEKLPSPEELARLETDQLKLGLATHEGARFLAPPDPYVFPHVAWALATHPSSSHMAYEIAREAVDGLDVSIRPV